MNSNHDGQGRKIATNLFRLTNFELFAKENKFVMMSGLLIMTGIVGTWGYQYMTTGSIGKKLSDEEFQEWQKQCEQNYVVSAPASAAKFSNWD
eukprot:CFRG3594T1